MKAPDVLAVVERGTSGHCPASVPTVRPHTMKPNPPGAVASLVCGILAVVFAYVPVLGVVLGIAAMVNAGRARSALAAGPDLWLPSGLPTAGQTCGIIGAVLSSLAHAGVLIAAFCERRRRRIVGERPDSLASRAMSPFSMPIAMSAFSKAA